MSGWSLFTMIVDNDQLRRITWMSGKWCETNPFRLVGSRWIANYWVELPPSFFCEGCGKCGPRFILVFKNDHAGAFHRRADLIMSCVRTVVSVCVVGT